MTENHEWVSERTRLQENSDTVSSFRLESQCPAHNNTSAASWKSGRDHFEKAYAISDTVCQEAHLTSMLSGVSVCYKCLK